MAGETFCLMLAHTSFSVCMHALILKFSSFLLYNRLVSGNWELCIVAAVLVPSKSLFSAVEGIGLSVV